MKSLNINNMLLRLRNIHANENQRMTKTQDLLPIKIGGHNIKLLNFYLFIHAYVYVYIIICVYIYVCIYEYEHIFTVSASSNHAFNSNQHKNYVKQYK